MILLGRVFIFHNRYIHSLPPRPPLHPPWRILNAPPRKHAWNKTWSVNNAFLLSISQTRSNTQGCSVMKSSVENWSLPLPNCSWNIIIFVRVTRDSSNVMCLGGLGLVKEFRSAITLLVMWTLNCYFFMYCIELCLYESLRFNLALFNFYFCPVIHFV